ncbi:hypothetical protein ACFWBB_38055 [Streptomyces sp. NPDC060000]|uniref:hypothetical protein n=1 Tax=Streptomyces sp. NPDC060000 TaxID=3347031 RepID=UPI0036831A67
MHEFLTHAGRTGARAEPARRFGPRGEASWAFSAVGLGRRGLALSGSGHTRQEESETDEFSCSSATTAHTAITRELGEWLLDRLPG